MNNNNLPSQEKKGPDFSNFNGEQALYSRALQGFVDMLDGLPDRWEKIKLLLRRNKDRVDHFLGQ